MAPSATARSVASHPANCAPPLPASQRPNRTVPAKLGSVYAALATATQAPPCPAGASCSASQLTATMHMPSPSADTATPGNTLRSTGWLSTGQYGDDLTSMPPLDRTALAGING
jgi:hypothetical protein